MRVSEYLSRECGNDGPKSATECQVSQVTQCWSCGSRSDDHETYQKKVLGDLGDK